ncbi:MAG TPA: hypothetical protein PK280_18515 [Planctomycetota bacterium]|nr:hypothetical protein [Planctomycetota bacterium]
MTDGELLDGYAARGSAQALGALVERHAPMVYSACLRMTGDRRLAETATRAVFLMLARGARGLAGRRTICGWLHGAACRASRRALEMAEAEESAVETRALAAVD